MANTLEIRVVSISGMLPMSMQTPSPFVAILDPDGKTLHTTPHCNDTLDPVFKQPKATVTIPWSDSPVSTNPSRRFTFQVFDEDTWVGDKEFLGECFVETTVACQHPHRLDGAARTPAESPAEEGVPEPRPGEHQRSRRVPELVRADIGVDRVRQHGQGDGHGGQRQESCPARSVAVA